MTMLDIDELQLAVEASTTADRAPLVLRKVTEALTERLPAAHSIRSGRSFGSS